jgi:hypothetical protein
MSSENISALIASLQGNGAVNGLNADISFPADTALSTDTSSTSGNQLTTKSYVDTTSEGLHVLTPVHVATSTTLTTVTSDPAGDNDDEWYYNNNTLTYQHTENAIDSGTVTAYFDGQTLTGNSDETHSNAERVLVKNASNSEHNGIYYCSAISPPTLTRASDFNTSYATGPQEVLSNIRLGDFAFCESGTLNAGHGFVMTGSDGFKADGSAGTVGTHTIVFSQFSGLTATVAVNQGGTGQTSYTDGQLLVGVTSGNTLAKQSLSGDVTMTNAGVVTIENDAVDADKLASNAVVNASIAANAAIAHSKLAALASTKVLVGNGSNVATEVVLSGDVTMANTGAVTIGATKVVNSMIGDGAVDTEELADDAITAAKLASNAVVNASIAANAAIAHSKLAALASTKVLVGNGSNVATEVALSGDVSMTNAGAVTIGAEAVETSMIKRYDGSPNAQTTNATQVLGWRSGRSHAEWYAIANVCFLKGTKITLPDYSQKNIEDLTLEDEVLTYNIDIISEIKNKNILKNVEYSNMEGRFSKSGIKNIWINPTDSYLIINDKLNITKNHIIHFKRDNNHYFRYAEHLSIGDELFNDRGEYESVESIEEVNEKKNVYNFELDKDNTYFAENYLVHHYCELCSGYANII